MTTNLTTKPPEKDKYSMSFVPFGSKDEIKLSLEIIKRFVAVRTKSGATCDDAQAMKFMMLCQAQRLNPFAGDAFLVGYDKRNQDGSYTPQFSLITAHQSFLKRAEVSAEYEGMESGIILSGEDGVITEREGDFKMPTETVVGGWARVYRKGRKPTYRRLSIASMKPNYETPFWSGEKAPGQIVKCAEADALRATFPTLLGGMYVADEMASTTVIDIPAGVGGNLVQISNVKNEPNPDDREPPLPEKPAERPAAKTSATDELAEIVIKAGHDFETFQKWGVGSGVVPEAGSLSEFDDLKADTVKRLLRAQKGMLDGIARLKGGEAV